MYGAIASVIEDKGRAVFTTGPNESVREAVRQMNEHGIGSLVVMARGRVEGIISERDVLVRVVDAGRSPDTTRVREVMSMHPLTITPATRVHEAMDLMTTYRCRHLPVLDGDEVAGMVSIGDLLRWLGRRQQTEIQQLREYITGGAEL